MVVAWPLEAYKIKRESIRSILRALGLHLQRARRQITGRMAAGERAYQEALADRAMDRLRKKWPEPQKQRGHRRVRPEDLIPAFEDVEHALVARRYVLELMVISWEIWNQALGIEVAFDLTDPVVQNQIGILPVRMQNVNDRTRAAVREVLDYGHQRGWSIYDLVRGDPEAGIPGIRDVIVETYKNRSYAVARTELGFAQNKASFERYERYGVELQLVLDDGFPNSHPTCVMIGNGGAGTVVSLQWAQAHPLQHPNCVRAFAPYFGTAQPEDPSIQVWG